MLDYLNGGKMNKKKRIIIITLLLIVILPLGIGGTFIYRYIKEKNIYSNIIKSNWNIELPSEYKEVYFCDTGSSFLGDGERYHIFQYEENSNIGSSLNWKADKNIMIESTVFGILSSLNVPSEYFPDFEQEYKYYLRNEEDLSKLYIILSKDKDMVYIVENFQ